MHAFDLLVTLQDLEQLRQVTDSHDKPVEVCICDLPIYFAKGMCFT